MIDHRKACVWSHRGVDGLEHAILVPRRKWHGSLDQSRPSATADFLECQANRGINMACRDHLVAGLKDQALQNRVDAGRGVIDEHEIVSGCAEESRQRRGGFAQQPVADLRHEAYRLELHAPPPFGLGFEHCARRGTE